MGTGLGTGTRFPISQADNQTGIPAWDGARCMEDEVAMEAMEAVALEAMVGLMDLVAMEDTEAMVGLTGPVATEDTEATALVTEA